MKMKQNLEGFFTKEKKKKENNDYFALFFMSNLGIQCH